VGAFIFEKDEGGEGFKKKQCDIILDSHFRGNEKKDWNNTKKGGSCPPLPAIREW